MGDEWKRELTAAMDLERLLVERQQELSQIGESDIDDCLSSPNPLVSLKDLAYIDRERLVIGKALARVRAIIGALKTRARLVERNEKKRARVLQRLG